MEFNQPSISTPSGLNSQPYTPIDQTLKTPLEAPGEYPFNPPPLHHQNSFNSQNTIQQHQQPYGHNNSFYQNPQYAESDDILTDIDEPESNNSNNTNNSNNSNNGGASSNNASLKRPQYPMSNGMKNTSISNLSLNEMNLMNYNAQQQAQQQPQQQQPSSASIRLRSSLLNLRKQSLTRNNSNNWLHVGNIHSLRPRNSNASTDSLDCVPIQANLFNGGPGSSASNTPPHSAGIQSQSQSNYFPQQQPLSAAGSNIQSQTAYFPPPPPLASSQLQDYRDVSSSAPFQLPLAPPPFLQRSRSSTSGSMGGPSVPYHLNTESANAQALNNLNGRSSFNADANAAGFALDSPFEPHPHPLSAQQLLQQWGSQPCAQQYAQQQQYSQQRTLLLLLQLLQLLLQDDTVMDEARFNSNFNTNYVSLGEKKRDSLKLKRGMH